MNNHNTSLNSKHLPKVAVLIDGENISPDYARNIIVEARKSGTLAIKRVYGGFGEKSGWEKTAGLQLVYTGSGKNSADMKMAIQAVDFAHKGLADTFVIVSSDGDFSHLAHFLREMGHTILGIGEEKAPEVFRKACNGFFELVGKKMALPVTRNKKHKTAPAENEINQKIRQLVQGSAEQKGIEITRLNVEIRRVLDFKISLHPDKNWRTYLSNRPEYFICEPKGKDAKVRLR